MDQIYNFFSLLVFAANESLLPNNPVGRFNLDRPVGK